MHADRTGGNRVTAVPRPRPLLNWWSNVEGMAMSVTESTNATSGTAARSSHPLFSALVGLAALGVLLQGLWAGLFVQEGQEYDASWVSVHALGGEITIALAALATVVAFVTMRHQRRDLVVGAAALTVVLVLEAYIGGLIGDHSKLTAVHFPLAMALMGLSVWLPLRARRRDGAPVA